jgi:predicted Zn-dependent protease with MMP-like domain
VARGSSAGTPITRTASLTAPADRVRPKATPCLPSDPDAASGELAEEASDALAHGANERALACADEALRLAPRLVPALAGRAGALAALGRFEDARLAYSRALAVEPSDPTALLGAADLFVRRLGPARDALEAGLEYALRGISAAQARRDRTLVARLELVAGMAENDLGRSHLGLPHLDRAVGALPGDPDAVYERGVALYELCRFDDAQRAFERALALSPDDPWTLHQLGLLAERRGEARRADALLARARRLAPEEFQGELAIDQEAFRAEVQAAVAALPEGERRELDAVPIEIQDLPDSADLLAVDPPLSPSILGLFRGPSEDEPCTDADGPSCRAIVFYRKNLLRFARDRQELSQQVRVTLLHELGHLHGESDDELRERGLE